MKTEYALLKEERDRVSKGQPAHSRAVDVLILSALALVVGAFIAWAL